MAFGKRLRFFRTRKGLTQKQVGEAAGFKGNTSEVRMAQYETEARTPKEPLIRQLSEMYGVSPRAIKVPDIDSELGLMHTLFALEDMYGFRIANIDGALCLRPANTGSVSITMFDLFSKWYEQAEKVHKGEITKEEYDSWRYNFSEADLPGIRNDGVRIRKRLERSQYLCGFQTNSVKCWQQIGNISLIFTA